MMVKSKRITEDYHRQDIKIPKAVYEEIQKIAVDEFNAKVHHRSGKPEISSTLLYLVQLGIQSINEGIKLYTDTTPITNTDKQSWVDEVKRLIDEAIANHVDNCHNLAIPMTNTDMYTDTKVDSSVAGLYTDNKSIIETDTLSGYEGKELDTNTDNKPMRNTDTSNNDSEVGSLDTDNIPINNTDILSDIDTEQEDKPISESLEYEGTNTPETENKAIRGDSDRGNSEKKVYTKEEAIALLKKLPSEMTAKKAEEEIGMKRTYLSIYKKALREKDEVKKEKEMRLFAPWIEVLVLLEIPLKKGGKWINPYSQQKVE